MPLAVTTIAYAVFLCAMAQISVAAQMRRHLTDPARFPNAPWLTWLSYLLHPLLYYARLLAMILAATFLMFFARTGLTIAVFVAAMLVPVVLSQSDLWIAVGRLRHALDIAIVVGLAVLATFALDGDML